MTPNSVHDRVNSFHSLLLSNLHFSFSDTLVVSSMIILLCAVEGFFVVCALVEKYGMKR